jgi:uncharacterized repeat protein (TIGR01451 family)
MTVDNAHVLDGSLLVLNLAVTNYGPASATNVIVTATLPSSIKLHSNIASQGATVGVAPSICWMAGSIPSGTAITNCLVFECQQAGAFEAHARVQGDVSYPDPQPDNNWASVAWLADHSTTNASISVYALTAGDMVWMPLANRLLLSVQQPTPVGSNCLLEIDPVANRLGTLIPVGKMPNKLAISPDEQFAYVGMNADYQGVAKVSLLSGQVITHIGDNNVGFGLVDRIVVPPFIPNMFIVLNGVDPNAGDFPGNIDSYLDGIDMLAMNFWNYGCPTSITIPDNTGKFYGYSATANPPAFFRMIVTPNEGITLLDSASGLLSGLHTSIEYDGHWIYASTGTILDPENRIVIANIPGISSNALCKQDSTRGLVTYLTQSGDNWRLRQYTCDSFDLAGEFEVPGVLGDPKSLTSWGNGCYAFLTTSNQLFLVQPETSSGSIPGDWMMLHFGHGAAWEYDLSRPTDDADHDGMNNLHEYLAGTDPKNPASALKILGINPGSNKSVQIQWTAQPGKYYNIERATDLQAGFTALQTNILASGYTNSVLDLSATNQALFYRIQLSR